MMISGIARSTDTMRHAHALLLGALLLCPGLAGCTFEGDDSGECSDGADNDRNGLFDCDDPNCAGSPDCEGDDDDADDDAADDDAADDDAADDDAADDDVGDDDVSDDDAGDDDVSDDDVGDDDVGDDDVGDDDVGDDDTAPCTIPVSPSVVFSVTSGSLAGSHLLADGPWCEPDMDGVGYTMNFYDGGDHLMLKAHQITWPSAGDHADSQFAFWWDTGAYHVERWNGGVDCYIDFVTGYPGNTGCFQCAGVTVTGPGPSELTDVTDGAFRCP